MISRKWMVITIAAFAGFMNIMLWCAEPSPGVIMNRFSTGSLSILIVGGLSIIEWRRWRNSSAGMYNLNGITERIKNAEQQFENIGIHPNHGTECILFSPLNRQLGKVAKICKRYSVQFSKNEYLTEQMGCQPKKGKKT